MRYELTDTFVVPADLQAVWSFFSTAENLPKITPPWLHFTIDSPRPIELKTDYIIDYTIRWLGLPLHWKTRILAWEPPHRFIDLQEKGPYRFWHHEHTFEPRADGTLCRDVVKYELPFGPLGPIGQFLMVRRQLMQIFTYRQQIIRETFGGITMIEQPTIRRIAL